MIDELIATALSPSSLLPLLRAVSRIMELDPLTGDDQYEWCFYCKVHRVMTNEGEFMAELTNEPIYEMNHADDCAWKVLSDLTKGET